MVHISEKNILTTNSFRFLVLCVASTETSNYLLLALVKKKKILFGAETWVVTPRMGKSLGGFQT